MLMWTQTSLTINDQIMNLKNYHVRLNAFPLKFSFRNKNTPYHFHVYLVNINKYIHTYIHISTQK